MASGFVIYCCTDKVLIPKQQVKENPGLKGETNNVETSICRTRFDHSGGSGFTLVLGFYSHMEIVYGAFLLVVCLGFLLQRKRSALRIAGAALAGSVVFFVVTNFGVWAFESLYPKTAAGLLACYVAAIPFFQNTLVGDALYTAVLFGGFAVAEKLFPILRERDLRHAQSA